VDFDGETSVLECFRKFIDEDMWLFAEHICQPIFGSKS